MLIVISLILMSCSWRCKLTDSPTNSQQKRYAVLEWRITKVLHIWSSIKYLLRRLMPGSAHPLLLGRGQDLCLDSVCMRV